MWYNFSSTSFISIVPIYYFHLHLYNLPDSCANTFVLCGGGFSGWGGGGEDKSSVLEVEQRYRTGTSWRFYKWSKIIFLLVVMVVFLNFFWDAESNQKQLNSLLVSQLGLICFLMPICVLESSIFIDKYIKDKC